ncbi:MAG: bifunctional phosphoribosylaminoimidazolecarboxamide formyltransferase/IMP cyclohydrolase, partial [Phycisphaerales bacterium]
ENPHQKAELLRYRDDLRHVDLTVANAGFGSEKQISHNNYLDANAAVDLCEELTRGGGKPCCVFVKHTNTCGASIDDDRLEAYRKAYLGDPNAAMGGILAVNFPVDAEFAEAVMTSLQRWGKDAGAGAFFVEVWIAPSFDSAAVETIKSLKKWGANVRLLLANMDRPTREGEIDFKKIAGGVLLQTRDTVGLNEDQWKVVTRRTPSDLEMTDLRLAWLVCKHAKSNAITVCKDQMLLGSGAGQMSRVMSCRIATWLAKENGHSEVLAGAVAASDAFFPFADGPNILMDAGVTALIQPGGSKRDEDTIKACDERGVAMIFTGTRHFKH